VKSIHKSYILSADLFYGDKLGGPRAIKSPDGRIRVVGCDRAMSILEARQLAYLLCCAADDDEQYAEGEPTKPG
jgi:hypothetical protein